MIIVLYITCTAILLSIILKPILFNRKKYTLLKKYALLIFCILIPCFASFYYYDYLFSHLSPPTFSTEKFNNVSKQEITYQIFKKEMDYNKAKPFFVPGNISEYKNIKVHCVPTEPDIFLVIYSIRTTDNYWHAGNGKIEDDFWVTNKSVYVRLVKDGNYYKLVHIGTGL